LKALAISHKILLEYLREPLLLGLIFAFPVILLLFYAIAFGESNQGMAKYLKIMVLNQDIGATALDGKSLNLGEEFIASIIAAQFEGFPIFDVTQVPAQSPAEIALREHKAAVLLVVPPDFSQVLLREAARGGTATSTKIFLVGYPSSDLYVFARNMIESLIAEFSNQISGSVNNNLVIGYEFISGSGTLSDFEFGVPGLIVFGIMFITISTTMTMVREEVNGTLTRLRLTGIKARDLILGVTGAQLVIGILMVPFTFGCAIAMGFRGNGSILLAILVGILLSLAAVGLGLMTACLARNDGEAANLSAIIGVMMVIVSGAMYPMPKAPITTIAGRTIQVYDLLPPAHASEALKRILIYGDGFGDIAYELAGLVALSIIILAAGIWIYQKVKLG
jgi:ABC-type polysaccharide/polyol phosphate export permease